MADTLDADAAGDGADRINAMDEGVEPINAVGTLLAVPKRIRGGKGDGDTVEIELTPRGVEQRKRRRQR